VRFQFTVEVDDVDAPKARAAPPDGVSSRMTLVLAKAAGCRSKDLRYLDAAIRAGVVDPAVLLDRLETLPVDGDVANLIRGRVCRLGAEVGFDCPPD